MFLRSVLPSFLWTVVSVADVVVDKNVCVASSGCSIWRSTAFIACEGGLCLPYCAPTVLHGTIWDYFCYLMCWFLPSFQKWLDPFMKMINILFSTRLKKEQKRWILSVVLMKYMKWHSSICNSWHSTALKGSLCKKFYFNLAHIFLVVQRMWQRSEVLISSFHIWLVFPCVFHRLL